MFTIKWLDETYSKITSDDNAEFHALRKKYSIYVDGYRHIRTYKLGLWDGKKTLIDKDGFVYTGLIPDIVKHLKESNKQYTVENTEPFKYNNLVKHVDDFLDNLNLPDGVEARYYQVNALKYVAKYNRAIILAAPNAGKTFIQYIMTRFLLANIKKRVLVVVPKVDLVNQMRDDFIGLAGDKWANTNISTSTDKNLDNNNLGNIHITTWQSCFDNDAEWFENFGVLITDEVHRSNTESQLGIINKCRHIKYRVGLTGSLRNSESIRKTLMGAYGDIYTIVETSDMICEGLSTPVVVNMVNIEYPDYVYVSKKPQIKGQRPTDGKERYTTSVQYIINNQSRTDYIINSTEKMNGNILILFILREYGRNIEAELIKKYGDSKKIIYIDGTVDRNEGSDRRNIRDICDTNDNVIVVASYATFEMGIDVKNLHHLIYAQPIRVEDAVIQSVGRMLRKHQSKDMSYIYDICDDLPILKWWVGERKKVYKRDGLNVVNGFEKIKIRNSTLI